MASLQYFSFIRAAFAFSLLLIIVGTAGYFLVTRPALERHAEWISADILPGTGKCQVADLGVQLSLLKARGINGIAMQTGIHAPSGKSIFISRFPFDVFLAEQIQARSKTPVTINSSLSEVSLSFSCNSETVIMNFDRSATLGAVPAWAFFFWISGLIGGALGMAALLSKSLAAPLRKLSSHLRHTPLGAAVPKAPNTGITEFDQLACEIDDLRSRASKAVASRSAILMGLSHDLRKPLTRLRLTLDTEPSPTPETIFEIRQDILELQEALDEFMRAANSMASPAVPNGAQDVWSRLQRMHTDPRLTFIGQPDCKCPPLNAAALVRVATNLIENSLQHTSGLVQVSWTSSPTWMLCVSDSGPGLDNPHSLRMMQPFQTRNPVTETGDNLHAGLGLALVRILCEHNGWTLKHGYTSDNAWEICVIQR